MSRHVSTLMVHASFACWAALTAFGQAPAWMEPGPGSPNATCGQCGSASCNGLGCCPQSTPAMPYRFPSLRIGRGNAARGPGYPGGNLAPRLPRCSGCGGAGCNLCRSTGPLAPGYLRAAAFGWIAPNGCAGCQPNGYPPGASAYPFPWDCQAAQGYGNGYLNLGDTCCGPYWYDFLVEGVVLTRQGSASLGLSSDGIRGFGPPNLVLSSDSADFDYEPGFRVVGRFQTSAVTNLEASYLGGIDWDDRAVATSANDSLYSVFSDFGNTPLGGFEETDQASEHSVDVEGELDSVEVNYRRSWVSPDNRVNGSWFMGPRYIRFEDTLRFGSFVRPHLDPVNSTPDNPIIRGPAQSQYSVSVVNDLVGVQLGTGLVICLFPGCSIGGEARAGAYGNAADQRTLVTATTLPDPLAEAVSDTDFAFATEGSAYLIWQFHPLAKLRGGYQVLYLSGVGSAASNFNTVSPFDPLSGRRPFLDDDDQVFFHGANLGLEIGW